MCFNEHQISEEKKKQFEINTQKVREKEDLLKEQVFQKKEENLLNKTFVQEKHDEISQESSFADIEKEKPLNMSLVKEHNSVKQGMMELSSSGIFLNQSIAARKTNRLAEEPNSVLLGQSLSQSLRLARNRQAERAAIQLPQQIHHDLTTREGRQAVKNLKRSAHAKRGYSDLRKQMDRFVDSFMYAKEQLTKNTAISAPSRDLRLYRLIEPYIAVSNQFLGCYENDASIMSDKFREYYNFLTEIQHRYDAFLKYPESQRDALQFNEGEAPYAEEELNAHATQRALQVRVQKKMGLPREEESLAKKEEIPLKQAQRDGVHTIDQWLVRNLNHATSEDHSAFVSNILALRERERMFLYYFVERKLRHSATLADFELSQSEDYTPNLEVFKDRMIASRFRLFKRIGKSHIYWNKLDEAMSCMMKNKEALDIHTIPNYQEKVAQKEAEERQEMLDSIEDEEQKEEISASLKEIDELQEQSRSLMNKIAKLKEASEKSELDEEGLKSLESSQNEVMELAQRTAALHAKLAGISGSTSKSRFDIVQEDLGYATDKTKLVAVNGLAGTLVGFKYFSQIHADAICEITQTTNIKEALQRAAELADQNPELASHLAEYNNLQEPIGKMSQASLYLSAVTSAALLLNTCVGIYNFFANYKDNTYMNIGEELFGLTANLSLLTKVGVGFSEVAQQAPGILIGQISAGAALTYGGVCAWSWARKKYHLHKAKQQLGIEEGSQTDEAKMIRHSERLNKARGRKAVLGMLTGGALLAASLVTFPVSPILLGGALTVGVPLATAIAGMAMNDTNETQREFMQEKIDLSYYLTKTNEDGQQVPLTGKERKAKLKELVKECANTCGYSSTKTLYSKLIAQDASNLHEKLFTYNGQHITRDLYNNTPEVREAVEPYIRIAKSFGIYVKYRNHIENERPNLAYIVKKMSG